MKKKLNPSLIEEILAAISIPFFLLFSPAAQKLVQPLGNRKG